MALNTCKLCRKLFTAESGKAGGKVCPECRQRLDELYSDVRHYLRDHPRDEFNVEMVADALSADIRDVQELVDLGYLERDLPEGADAPAGDRQKLVKAFEASIDKLKASAAAAAAHKPVSYGQEVYGDKAKKR